MRALHHNTVRSPMPSLVVLQPSPEVHRVLLIFYVMDRRHFHPHNAHQRTRPTNQQCPFITVSVLALSTGSVDPLRHISNETLGNIPSTLSSNTSSTMASPIAEKVVQPAVNPKHMAYCPTMDLIALATVDEQVQVYRLNGQKVFSVHSRDSTAKIGRIKWKPNGKICNCYLCVKREPKTSCKASHSPLCLAMVICL